MTKKVSLKHRVCLFLIAGALDVSPLGRGFSLHKNDSFLIIETADIGSIVRNVRLENCGKIDKRKYEFKIYKQKQAINDFASHAGFYN